MSFIITAPPEIARGLDAVFRVVYLAAWVGFASIYFRGQYAVERLRQFVRFLIGFGFAISVLQIIAAPDRFQIAGEVRAFGVSSHPVLFGMLMLLAIVADEILRLKLDRSKSVTDYVIRLMGLLAMTFAVAQTAWLMLAIIIVVLASYNVPRRLRGVSFLLLAGVSMGMIYALPWTRDLFSLFEIFTSFGEISSDVYSYHLVDNSMAWRVVNWKMSLSAAMPVWYSGFGPGHSEFYNYFGLTLHNMFFEVFVETGVFGLLFLFAIVLEITRCLRQSGHVGALGEVRARRLFVAFSLSLFAACVLSVTLLGQTLLLTLYFSLLVIVTTPTSEMG
ncbi:O-antigen ligase family protein [Halocynthiibacter sp. C4]|uniref:O-antigen ligase family protein n=1 Tax=Halocynthiibacter sp. C4 TaxID=2992758 RepID=UPI00237B94C5|nr:O-antigen ligase family protein [Halocynthiibacter sp. C4]MDE0590914.1 O-antigen ligase family protein [Halocynthiibacter sp. C4]